MTVQGSADQRGQVVASAFAVVAIAVLTVAVFTNSRPQYVAPLTAFLMLLMITWRSILAWRSLVAITVLLIFFIPIKRYEIPASLPFQLEPYRIFIAFAALGWIASLLVDPRVRLRKSGIEAPLLLFSLAVAASLLANPGRLSSVSSEAVKFLIFFASFFVVFYLTVSSIRRIEDVDFVVKWLVGGGAVIGVFALFERRTGYNVFNHLGSFLPLDLNPDGVPTADSRGGRLRVAASAQHPIALGAALALLIPLAVYAAYRTRQRRWIFAAVVISVAMFSTASRTAVVMLGVIVLVLFFHRPHQMKRMWPALLPVLLVIHVAAPGALGTVKSSFFPEGGLIAQQQSAPVGNARLSTLGPTLRNEWAPHPIVGEGFATRVTRPTEAVPVPNAPILDDQWLGVLAETGVFGTFAFAWMFVRFLRGAGRAARADQTYRGWLLLATIASVAAYAVGMFTYDSFTFIQVTFLLFIILGLGCSAWQAGAPATVTVRGGRRLEPGARSPRAYPAFATEGET